METSVLVADSKLTEISKNSINIIQIFRKVILILLKKRVMAQKSSSPHSFQFGLKVVCIRSVLQLEKCSKQKIEKFKIV